MPGPIPTGETADAAIRVAAEFFRNPLGMSAVTALLIVAVLWRTGMAAKNETIKVIATQLEATVLKAAADLTAAATREEWRVLEVQKRADEYRAERNQAEARMMGMGDELRALALELGRHMPDLKRLRRWTQAKEREEEDRTNRTPRPRTGTEGTG